VKLLLLGIPGLVSLGCTVAGFAKRKNDKFAVPIAGFALLVVAGTIVALLLIASTRRAGVPDARAMDGTYWGAVALVPIPAITYFTLGRLFVGRENILAWIWLGGLVPLYLYLLLAWFWVADRVICTPEQYECPL
jgi:hypothetical protein